MLVLILMLVLMLVLILMLVSLAMLVLIQLGPLQMNPRGLPGMNLGFDAGTDGRG